MSLIDWELYTERAVGRGSPTYPDVANRPLREVLTVSGYDPDQDFAGFAKTTHTHDASAIATGTLAPARGGTGLSSPTLGGLLVAAAAAAMTLLAPGASGQVVKSTGSAWASSAIVSADITDAASANTPSVVVKRDASGNFSAGTITATAFAGSGAALTSIPNTATTATSANTPSAIVARDGAGNFTAGTITAALAGNASTATALATPRAINGVNFDGSAPITVKATATNALTIGTHLTGGSYDGSAPISIATDATSANTASTIVARDASGNFSAGAITATSFTGALAGNASTATKLAAAVNINGVAFDGSGAITVAAAATTLTGTVLAVNVVTSSLTAVGTLATGVWQATTIAPLFGGTGVANSNTITLGGNISTASAFTTAGAFGLTLTTTGVTNVTLPTSGTLVNTAVATLSNLTTIGTLGALNVTGLTTLTSTSAAALTVGANGATNPAFQVDASATSAATGLKVTANAATAGLALSVLSSGANEGLTIDAKGSGTITIGATSTGAITVARALTLTFPNSAIVINTAAGNFRLLEWQSGGLKRWQVGVSSTAETGSNVGSNFVFSAFDDTGTVIDSPFTMGRSATGTITLGGTSARPVSLSGALTVAGATTHSAAVTISAGGLTVSTGTTSLQAVTAASLSFGGTVAAAGTIKLANAVILAWRSGANNDDLRLTVNGSNVLVFDNAATSTPQAIAVGAITSASGVTVSAGGLAVNAGTSAVQALTTTGLNSVATGQVSVATGVATTLFSLASIGAPGESYLVTYGGSGFGGGGWAIIVAINGTYSIAQQAATGTGSCTLSMSGANVQLTQTSGGAQFVFARAVRIA